jgi:hypothetical protein
MSCTISEFAARKFNLINSDERQFILNVYQKDKAERIRMNFSTAFSQRIGLAYSRFEFMKQEVGISFETYAELAGLESYKQLPIAKVKVKVKDP